MRKLLHVLSFAWARQRVLICAGLIAFVAIVLLYQHQATKEFVDITQSLVRKTEVAGLITTAFSVAAFIVAALVYVGEMQEDWEESLPKRLRVIFLFDAKPVMVCEDATLVAEGDIRALAQQLGAQINTQRNLVIEPFIDLKPSQIVKVDDEYVQRYEIRLTLGELPATVATKREEEGWSEGIVVRRKENGIWKDNWVHAYS